MIKAAILGDGKVGSGVFTGLNENKDIIASKLGEKIEGATYYNIFTGEEVSL